MRLCAFMSWPFWFVFHFSWHAFWNLFPFLIEIPLFVEFCVLCQSLVYILWISFHLMFQSSCLDEIHWDVHIYLLWSVGSLRFIYLFICLFILENAMRERQRDRSSICWCTSQMAGMARAGPDRSQELPPVSLECQDPSTFVAFSGAVAGNWVRSEAGRIPRWNPVAAGRSFYPLCYSAGPFLTFFLISFFNIFFSYPIM